MKNISRGAVSLLEVMIAIMIFFLGLISVYSVVSSTLQLNQYNENFIIGSNLAREQIGIIQNIRDYNFQNIRKWDSINADADLSWEIGEYYTIENIYTGSDFLDFEISKLDNFATGIDEISGAMQEYKLCLDSAGHYSYNCLTTSQATPFFRYLFVEEVSYINEDGEVVIIPDALKFSSQVIWYQGGYHQTQVSIILTDWQRL